MASRMENKKLELQEKIRYLEQFSLIIPRKEEIAEIDGLIEKKEQAISALKSQSHGFGVKCVGFGLLLVAAPGAAAFFLDMTYLTYIGVGAFLALAALVLFYKRHIKTHYQATQNMLSGEISTLHTQKSYLLHSAQERMADPQSQNIVLHVLQEYFYFNQFLKFRSFKKFFNEGNYEQATIEVLKYSDLVQQEKLKTEETLEVLNMKLREKTTKSIENGEIVPTQTKSTFAGLIALLNKIR